MSRSMQSRLRCLCGVVIFACSISGTLAAEPTVLDLWPGVPPGAAREIGSEADLTKPEDRLIAGRRIIKLGNVTTPQLHVDLPPRDKQNGTAVVICPGGGFHILAWDLEGTEVAEWLNTIGRHCAEAPRAPFAAKQLAPCRAGHRTGVERRPQPGV